MPVLAPGTGIFWQLRGLCSGRSTLPAAPLELGETGRSVQVRLLFFGVLKDLTGKAGDTLDLPEGTTLAALQQICQEQNPGLKRWTGSLAMAVNQEYAAGDIELRSGDEVAMLPPVSGGSGKAPAASLSRSQIAIVREKIDTLRVVDELKRPEDGAAVVFEGVVRDHSRGRRTLYLDYEAYESMALRQMKALAEEAKSRFEIRGTAMVHRLGRLEIGETSVLVAVVSAHRAPAFDACRWLIDSLKQTVPIWKKEYFADGAVWAAGEPFPADVAGPPKQPSRKACI